MSLPFDAKRVREYEVESGAGGQRLGCKFRFDDGSMLFVHESQITAEIERFISSLGSPTAEFRSSIEVVLKDFDGTRTIYPANVPLPELIAQGDTDEGILVKRRYARTDQRDERGRTVYVERN